MLRDRIGADSFTEFARQIEPGLRRALTAGFGSDVGREAAAEALAYGWEHWDRVEGLKNPAGYLFRVGQRKAQRMVGRSRVWGRDEVAFSEPWVEPRFETAWVKLSGRQRIVFGLIHAFDWSLAEVAQLLGVSKSSVQSYEQRAMRHLRKSLGVGG